MQIVLIHPNDRSGGAEITGNPLCAGEHTDMRWREAVCLRLFQTLVSAACRNTETACGAPGDAPCCFRIDWQLRSPP